MTLPVVCTSLILETRFISHTVRIKYIAGERQIKFMDNKGLVNYPKKFCFFFFSLFKEYLKAYFSISLDTDFLEHVMKSISYSNQSLI